MVDKKGLSSFTSFIIAIIIIIPIVIVVLIIFIYGASSISSVANSPESYVTQSMVALTTGESVVVGATAPSLDGNSGQFMAQFYGSQSCISSLNQLSRTGILSAPNDPATLQNKYFVCIGAVNTKNILSDTVNAYQSSSGVVKLPYNSWLAYPFYNDAGAFPLWFPAAYYLNAINSANTSGINGSHGTLSYFVNQDPQTALGDSCAAFFNATTQYGFGSPGAYVTTLNCAVEGESNGIPVFMSVQTQQCKTSSQYGCSANPWAFLFGDPGQIGVQTCSYISGAALICSFSIN